MKKIIFILLMLPFTAFAQKLQQVMVESYCVNLQVLEKALGEYEEVPFIRGVTAREPVGTVAMVVFANPHTKTWTLVEKMGPDIYCVVSAGNNLEPAPK